MSPASAAPGPSVGPPADQTLYSWVGIIMYLSTENSEVRMAIAEKFKEYCALTRKMGASKGIEMMATHWAKLEVPIDETEVTQLQAQLRSRFPVDRFNEARLELDPNKIMSNGMIDTMFGS